MQNLKLSRPIVVALVGIAVVALGYLGVQNMQSVNSIIVPLWWSVAAGVGFWGLMKGEKALSENDSSWGKIIGLLSAIGLIVVAYLLLATAEPAIQIKGATWEKPNFLIIPERTVSAPTVAPVKTPTDPEKPAGVPNS